MNIPEGFTPRGDSNEQPPETYDKTVHMIMNRFNHAGQPLELLNVPANSSPWKAPDGACRILAWRLA